MKSCLRKLLAFTLVCAILFSSATPVMAQNNETSEYMCEVLVRANLREAPSTDGRWIMTVPAGALVLVLEETQTDYFYISYDGVEGYIYTGCIIEVDVTPEEGIVTNSAQASEVPAVDYEAVREQILQRAEEIRLEREALEAERAAEAEALEAEILEAEQIAAELETEVPQDSMEAEPENEAISEETIVSNRISGGLTGIGLVQENTRNENQTAQTFIAEAEVLANARLRRYPSADGEKLFTIPQGSIVQVIDDGENGYTHVSFEGSEGYIFNRCISYETGSGGRAARSSGVITTVSVPENAIVQEESSVGAMGNASMVLNQRRSASTAAAVSVAPQVSVTATASAMPEIIENSEPIVQTVQQQDLAAENSVGIQVSTIENTVRSGTEFEIANRANMRQTPSSEGTWLATLPIGAQVTLLGENADGYTMVQYDGMVGYVLDSCVVDMVDMDRLGEEPVLFTITAYCSCRICCGNYSPEVTGRESRTATGTIPEEGRTIAVDPTVIPYGTVVHIDGMGDFIAEDCGGMVKENHIDVYFTDHNAAVQFGVQRRYVTIN